MKKPEDQISLINPGAPSIAEALGITPERRTEIQKRIDEICKADLETEEEGKPAGAMNAAKITVAVWNEFEEKAECAYAMLILDNEENRVGIHSLFALPESVTTE